MSSNASIQIWSHSSSMLRSISSSIMRSMTIVQLDAIELGLRFHRQFSALPRPDAHEIGVDHLERTKPSVEVWILRAPRAFIEDLRVNQGCHTLVTLWSNPCASTERPARDFMVGAKLRNAKRVLVVGADCKCVVAVRAVAGLPILSHRRANEQKALQLFRRSTNIGLILLSTPIMRSGIFLEHLRHHRTTAGIPIVVITDSPGSQPAGVTAALPKPVEINRLLALVHCDPCYPM